VSSTASLARRLDTRDAVVIGLGSMIGAGVFAAFGPAAKAAGSGLLIGLALAAAVAYCNAVASAQLAAQYPTSGGTYVYGRERLGEWWGFCAGWGFVIGKTASCAAMALTFASYAVGGSLRAQRIVALLAVVALTAVNYRGITRTAGLARVLVAVSLLALIVVVTAIAASGETRARAVGDLPFGTGGVHGILQAAALLFFAFAGYARIATLGEEVIEPSRTIPRAIPIALGLTVALYAAVGLSALAAAGPAALAGPDRRGGREPRFAPRVDRGPRSYEPRDGAQRGPAAPAGLGPSSLPGPPSRRARDRCGRRRARPHDGPPRRDRVLVVRRARLLRRRQRVGVHAVTGASALAAGTERPRRDRLPRARGVVAAVGRRRRAARVRRRLRRARVG
jgi:Amino acid permease